MFFDDDEFDYIPIARRSIADRHALKTHHFISDHNDSPHDQHLSRCVLNNSISFDSANDESIQTPIQLITLYEKTIELAAKNKINAKNAFNIGLVERLPEILDIVAFDDKIDCSYHEPNFVKAGSVIDTSAKIYGFRVDALHAETQRLNGSIQQKDETNEDSQLSQIRSDQSETTKKVIQRSKPKASSYLVTDLSSISLPYEFDFHPFQRSTMCPWPGGVGDDTIYADMVSYTMYSSSDFPLVNGFINLNSRVNREFDGNERILEITMKTIVDFESLRETIKDDQDSNHFLGCQSLREFSFNEDSTNSYIDTIDECSIIDSSLLMSPENETTVHHDQISHGFSELRDDRSQFYFHELQSAHTFPTTMISMEMTSIPSRMSFVDQIPYLLRDKTDPSDYNIYDATKLKLFAGPFLWKFTNLLPSPTISTVETSTVRLPQKKISSSIRSKRSFKFNLSRWEKSPTIDDLMNPEHWYRRRGEIKMKYRKVLRQRRSIVNDCSRQRNFFQLRLARRIQSLKNLSSLHHFPEWNFDYFLNPFDKISLVDDETHPSHCQFDHDDVSAVFIEPIEYDFSRPVHYEKIEIDRNFSKIDAKKLQIELVDEYKRQIKRTSTIHLSDLLSELIDHGLISNEKDQLVSAFYCMLNNCHRNHLFLWNNSQHDDLSIETELKKNSTTIIYSHSLNSQ